MTFSTYYVKSGTRIAEHASICVYKTDKCFFIHKWCTFPQKWKYKLFSVHIFSPAINRCLWTEVGTTWGGNHKQLAAPVLLGRLCYTNQNHPNIPLRSWHLWKAMYLCMRKGMMQRKFTSQVGVFLEGLWLGSGEDHWEGPLSLRLFHFLSSSLSFLDAPLFQGAAVRTWASQSARPCS